MFGAILKATDSSFQKGITFCRSIYVTKVMNLLAFIFEQPSYFHKWFHSTDQSFSGERPRSWPSCFVKTLHGFMIFFFVKMLPASMTLWRGYDVRKFDASAILFREIQHKKRDIILFK